MSTIVPSDLADIPSPLWLEQNETAVHRSARDWLFDETSLTRRLTELSSGTLVVAAVRETLEMLREDECTALQLQPGATGWVREVLLQGQGTSWVFARTVIGQNVLAQSDLDLRGLGGRPLGELLFGENAFARQPIEVCQYPTGWLPEGQQVEGLWARRSRFDRGTTSLLVVEVFLPAFWWALMSAPASR